MLSPHLRCRGNDGARMPMVRPFPLIVLVLFSILVCRMHRACETSWSLPIAPVSRQRAIVRCSCGGLNVINKATMKVYLARVLRHCGHLQRKRTKTSSGKRVGLRCTDIHGLRAHTRVYLLLFAACHQLHRDRSHTFFLPYFAKEQPSLLLRRRFLLPRRVDWNPPPPQLY